MARQRGDKPPAIDHSSELETVDESELDAILESLTVAQLRDVAFALKRELPDVKDRSELIAAIRHGTDTRDLTTAAHKVETLSPFKHAYLFTFREEDAADIRDKLLDFCSTFARQVGAVDYSSRDLAFQFSMTDVDADVFFLKLVHSVPHYEWAESTETQRNLRKFVKRHPVVAAFRLREQLVTVSFPGFNQGSGTPVKQRIRYPDIAAQAQAFIGEHVAVAISALEIRSAVESLLASAALEVKDIRRRSRPAAGGRIEIDASDVGMDATSYLQAVFGSAFSVADLRRSLEAGAIDDIVLRWKRINMETRIHFGDVAPEILFIWRRSGPSMAFARYVLQQLLAYRRTDPEALTKLRDFVLSLPPGFVAKTSALMQQFSVSTDEVLGTIKELITERAVAPRFRIRTDKIILDYENTWKEEVTELPELVIDEDGQRISALDPTNIEIGYARVR